MARVASKTMTPSQMAAAMSQHSLDEYTSRLRGRYQRCTTRRGRGQGSVPNFAQIGWGDSVGLVGLGLVWGGFGRSARRPEPRMGPIGMALT